MTHPYHPNNPAFSKHEQLLQGHRPRTERAMGGERWRVRLGILKKKGFFWPVCIWDIFHLCIYCGKCLHAKAKIHFQTGAISQFQGARVPAMLSLDLLTWRILKMGMPKARSSCFQIYVHACWQSFGFLKSKIKILYVACRPLHYASYFYTGLRGNSTWKRTFGSNHFPTWCPMHMLEQLDMFFTT